MNGFALALILVAAFIHASWNFLAKRVGGGAVFVWLFAALSAAVYLPIALGVYLWQRPHIGGIEALFLLGSAVLHLFYFLLLQRGYAHGDLSVVYPVARGSGPMLSTAAAIGILGEQPTLLAMAGAALIVAGVFIISGGFEALTRGHAGRSVAYGLATGALIACYTLWDKVSVSTLLLPPIIVDYCSNLGRTVLLTPHALKRREEVRALWSRSKREILWVALLTPLSYILVLTAMAFTPVSYVAPAREVSVLIAVAMGTGLLSEGQAGRRMLAAGLIVIGVVLLAQN
ncbi:MAG TPA: DMT family transporter [Syntrophales bacterium]